MKRSGLRGMGWERDLPDFRDYTTATESVKAILARSRRLRATVDAALPSSVDLRPWCSPIEDQGDLGSCTANAGVGLLEYFERRAFGTHVDASRLFLYKVTRNLLGWVGDQGAYLRDTMKAMVLLGVPPEEYLPYDVDKFDDEPSAFCYSLGQNYQSVRYYRHDPPGTAPADLLTSVKRYLAAQLPSMFGFTVYSSIPSPGDGRSEIPFPTPADQALGGHALVAIGYDDAKRIEGRTGALLIRNSWGASWGAAGYGWLPYAYVETGLAVDFWSLVRAEYVNTGLFGLGEESMAADLLAAAPKGRASVPQPARGRRVRA
ncbi:MAG TPA: C1 family peptidase [Planctomycetota bacterium]|nr:C1 family peptidase [Planctomycetota bacterium]